MTEEHGDATDDTSRGAGGYHPSMMQALGTLHNLANLITGSNRGPGGEELGPGDSLHDDNKRRADEEGDLVAAKRHRSSEQDDLAAHGGGHMHLHMQEDPSSDMQQQHQQHQQQMQAYAMQMAGSHDGGGGPTADELAAAGLSASGLGLPPSIFGGAGHLLPHLASLAAPGTSGAGGNGPGSAMTLLPAMGLGPLPPGTTPEALLAMHGAQLAALQAQGGAGGQLGLSAEMLAAAAQGGFGMPGADGGQFPNLGPDLPSMGLDAATLAAVAGGGAGPLTIPLDYLNLPHLPPELLASLQAGTIPFGMLTGAGGYGMPGMGGPGGQPATADPNMVYKNWWDENDEKELLRLVGDGDYRRAKLGSEDLDWQALEAHFHRSQNALRKKYWMLSKAPPPGTGDLGPKQRAERKNWSEEETGELKRLVAAQSAADGEAVDWEKLAALFGTSVQTVKRKHRHAQENAALAGVGAVAAEKGKRQHHRKNVPYRWMIVYALSQMPSLEGTALQIFDAIEAYPPFVEQLDTRIMPGTKHVPRWKIQVRKVLSADHIFINTGQKQKHETVWRLDPMALQEANAERQRQRAGLPPIQFPPEVTASLAAQGGGGGAPGPGDGGASGLQHLPTSLPMDVSGLGGDGSGGLGAGSALMQQVLEAAGQAAAAAAAAAAPPGHVPDAGAAADAHQAAAALGLQHALGMGDAHGVYGSSHPPHDYMRHDGTEVHHHASPAQPGA